MLPNQGGKTRKKGRMDWATHNIEKLQNGETV